MSPRSVWPDPLSPDALRTLLRSDFWVRVEGGGPTGSTNDDARTLAESGAPEGTVVIASSQRSGRGRFERTWTSPKGGVYFSAILRPEVAPDAFAALPLVVGLGVVRGLESLGVDAALKWPNDVLLGGRKVGGILVETQRSTALRDQEPSRDGDPSVGDASPSWAWAVAGVGLNVVSDPDGPPLQNAAFLEDVRPGIALTTVAAATLDGLAEVYGRFLRGGFVAIRDDYRAVLEGLGARVTVSDATGAIVADGVARDIDAQGRLVVEAPTGEVLVASGEVTLRRFPLDQD